MAPTRLNPNSAPFYPTSHNNKHTVGASVLQSPPVFCPQARSRSSIHNHEVSLDVPPPPPPHLVPFDFRPPLAGILNQGALFSYPTPLTSFGVMQPRQPVIVNRHDARVLARPPLLVSSFNLAPSDTLYHRLRWQIEYYFSDENLLGEWYLTSKECMDEEGWVKITVIAKFNRVAEMTKNLNLAEVADTIRAALSVSDTVEVQGDRIRRRPI